MGWTPSSLWFAAKLLAPMLREAGESGKGGAKGVWQPQWGKGKSKTQTQYLDQWSSGISWKGKGKSQTQYLDQWSSESSWKGKGKSQTQDLDQKSLHRLGKIDSSLKIFVSGLGTDFPSQALETHFEELTGEKPTLMHVYHHGIACIAVKTEETVAGAIALMNGTYCAGQIIACDVWEKKEKSTDKKEKPKVKRTHAKKHQPNRKLSLLIEDIKHTDASLKVWVGSIAPEVTATELKNHFAEKGCKTVIVEVMGNGSGVATFESADQVASAVALVNGTQLGGQSLEASVWTKHTWTKPEKKGKKPKEDDGLQLEGEGAA